LPVQTHPSGPEGQTPFLAAFCGTAEAVPFQSSFIEISWFLQFHLQNRLRER
jgi:hypothetical protein